MDKIKIDVLHAHPSTAEFPLNDLCERAQSLASSYVASGVYKLVGITVFPTLMGGYQAWVILENK